MISIFELFSIGMGPSSSHTVGPMRAARRFVASLAEEQRLPSVARLEIHLYGSLALTGWGHGTHTAVLLGAMGEMPESVDTETVTDRIETLYRDKELTLLGGRNITFDPDTDLLWHKDKSLPFHSNGMEFKAFDASGTCFKSAKLYSVGGGFIVSQEDLAAESCAQETRDFPYAFDSAAALMALCARHELSIADLMRANERQWRTLDEVRAGILKIWRVMDESIERGCRREVDILPGGLKIRRRAPGLFIKLQEKLKQGEHTNDMDWLSVFAIAVNEENAACKRIVTAPTNGAAGIIPAVLKYHLHFNPDLGEDAIIDYLLTCAAIGFLYKTNASISAAEVGCQGEVGVACSMAAAGLAAIMGGTVPQIENAAEMGMEHHLGLTCDPIGGLVQIPCIERNAMGSVQAVNSARLALMGDGTHHVSLDKVIQTMFATGRDMSHIYKETALGGLAVNLPAC
jgi:L-serine dehydratase